MALVIQSRTKTQPVVRTGETNETKSSKEKSSETDGVKYRNSLVDSSWETIDPNPDIHTLFIQFNEEFFDGRLSGCEVRWSPRMTLCAGQCHYEGRGGLCSVRLSQPLLKFRPRKDLVETLLHEMIHAFLFVTENNKDHDGHGPEFQRHMNRINASTGTKISIYHSFHAEVAEHRQHWWRCEGPCRERKPFYGWVKRASNRAPGPTDFWHADHQKTCGGNFIKVKEPEGFQAKKSNKKNDPFSGAGYSLNEEDQHHEEPVLKKAKTTGKKSTDKSKTAAKTATSPSKTLDDYFSKLPGVGHTIGGSFHASTSIGETVQASTSAAVSSTSSLSQKSAEARKSVIRISDSVVCPICQSKVSETEINSHLDSCVSF